MLAAVALAFALAMDAFAASIAEGCAVRPTVRHALKLAIAFGLAQALMPLVGLGLGAAAGPLIADVDHWVAFVLLGIIGGRMVWNGWSGTDMAEEALPADMRTLALLAFATSIDAAAAGMTLPFLDISPYAACMIIGLVTFGMSFAGVMAGTRIGRTLGGHAEAAGGLVLIVLGAQMLAEHLSA